MAASARRYNFSNVEQLADNLPKFSYSLTGKPMEPINLIVIGHLPQIKAGFASHGWLMAERLGPLSLIKALAASVLDLPYSRGPFSPSYVNGRKFILGLQHPTASNTFRRRHHLRLWETPCRLHGQPVWVGTASYDRSIGLSSHGIPTHHIAPSLQWEEEFLAKSLRKKPAYLKLGEPLDSSLQIGDHYKFDGMALVLDMTTA